MRPLRKGKARTELAEGLAKVAHSIAEVGIIGDNGLGREKLAQTQAAVLGGAIEAAIEEINHGATPMHTAAIKRDFWRLTNENFWRLTRALEASRLLDKAGE